MRLIRVFPRRTSYTPTDDMAFVSDPPLIRPEADEVHVSCAFTWDKPESERLARAWGDYYPCVKLGGPAYGSPCDDFVPGRYVKPGVTFTSRGCPNHCWFCLVPEREGALRELPIVPGNVVGDNNLTACSDAHVDAVFAMLRTQRAVEFSGGLEAARIDARWAEYLKSISLKQLFLAYDRPSEAEPVKAALSLLSGAGLNRGKLRCFVLAAFKNDTPEAALARCHQVWDWGGLPFMMLYRDVHNDGRRDPQWRQVQHDTSGPYNNRVWPDLARKMTRPAMTKVFFMENQ